MASARSATQRRGNGIAKSATPANAHDPEMVELAGRTADAAIG